MISRCILFLLLSAPLFAQNRLFVIHAAKATFNLESQVLTFQEIEQPITYFSDARPEIANKTSLADFLYDISLRNREFLAGLRFSVDKRYNNLDFLISDPHYSFETKELTLVIKFLHKEDTLSNKLLDVTLSVDHVEKRAV